MFELAYCSIANSNTNKNDILAILKTAREFNAKHNITGCLVYHNNQFAQILEGDKKLVLDLYSNIEQDNRHYNINLLYTGEKDKKTFNSWSMAFQDIGDEHIKIMNHTIFEKNILLLSDFSDRPTGAIKLFWQRVKQIILN